MKPVIQVKNLIKKYKKSDTKAVDDISFEVNEGEFFAFLGPNGAGKTTTISILTTTLSKTSGTVKIAGYDTDTQSSQVRQNVGIIFQNPSLDLNLSAEENIRFHSVLYGLFPFMPTYGLMPSKYRQRLQELSHILGLGNDIFKPIKTFSGGMKRKLEIIRALMHKPKVLFLDEPTIGLDPLSRKTLWEYLMQVREQEKTTIFLTTHYLDEAENTNRLCIINKGKIVAAGTPAEIKRHLIEEYLLINSKNRQLLENELKKLNLKYSGKGPFKVSLGTRNPQKIIQSIKSPLTTLLIHLPTLEDAYLEIIAGEKTNA